MMPGRPLPYTTPLLLPSFVLFDAEVAQPAFQLHVSDHIVFVNRWLSILRCGFIQTLAETARAQNLCAAPLHIRRQRAVGSDDDERAALDGCFHHLLDALVCIRPVLRIIDAHP